jgi:hypothetical protein
MVCNNNQTEICGGPSLLTVYEMGLDNLTSPASSSAASLSSSSSN